MSNDQERIRKIINSHQYLISTIATNNLNDIKVLCEHTIKSLKNGGKLLFLGNGGSAADCQHLAAEFIGRFKTERKPLPAIALTTDTSIITSIGNDFGYESIFERQMLALCSPNDIAIGISTSGNSKNIIRAIEVAQKKKAWTVGLLGNSGGELGQIVDLPIIIHSSETARVQEAHILVGHILCEFCDEHFTLNS